MFFKKIFKKVKKELFIKKNKDNPLVNAAYNSFISTKCLRNKKDVSLGRYVYGSPVIHPGYGISKLLVGSFTCFGPGVVIFLASHHNPNFITTYPLSWLSSKSSNSLVSKGDVIIGNDVWIGQNSIILPGVKIGDGVIVGAGSVVTKDVDPYSVVCGVPAKVVRKRFSKDEIIKLNEIKWWNWSDKEIYDAISIIESNNIEALYDLYLSNKHGS